jgi:large subunit ribosomal protein L7/L12
MADLAKIVDDLSKLTVLEAAELAKLLEEKWGVSAAAPVAVAAAPAGAAAPAAEEKTEFTVILKSGGDKKLNVIKEVRALIPGLGIKEAKDLVESGGKTVKDGRQSGGAEPRRCRSAGVLRLGRSANSNCGRLGYPGADAATRRYAARVRL